MKPVAGLIAIGVSPTYQNSSSYFFYRGSKTVLIIITKFCTHAKVKPRMILVKKKRNTIKNKGAIKQKVETNGETLVFFYWFFHYILKTVRNSSYEVSEFSKVVSFYTTFT